MLQEVSARNSGKVSETITADEKKGEKKSTGSAANKKRAIYWERLQFSDAVEDERESFTNVSPAPINQ